MAARGEAHDADAVGRNVEFGRARTNQANGALRVAQLDWMVIARAKTIREDESGHAERVEPVRYLPPFVVRSEKLIRASGSDNHGRPRRLPVPGREILDGGFVGFLRTLGAGSVVFP